MSAFPIRLLRRNLSIHGTSSESPTGFDGAPWSTLPGPATPAVRFGSGIAMSLTRRARASATCWRATSICGFRVSASAMAWRRERCNESPGCWPGAIDVYEVYEAVDDELPGVPARRPPDTCACAAPPIAASAHRPKVRRMLSLKSEPEIELL